MARLTQDKTAAAFDARIGVIKDEIETCDDTIAATKAVRGIAIARLEELQRLRAELLDDATDEDE